MASLSPLVLRQARRGRWWAPLIAFLFSAAPSIAQPVTSEAPTSVSVSIYRGPDRPASRVPDPAWLEGYALVTETRTVRIPAGRAVIRFEGVAGGILPESAIVTGLPAGVREKNLDADLLSPFSLYARSLNRPVTIRRRRDGRIEEERAIIRSGPDGAAILQTASGFIAADCQGRDSLVYDALPPGLSAKPTLSVETDSPREGMATLTLSYLAWGFDWQADYVATMRPDGQSADLFAWVTLASGDPTSFADAETMVVAGKPNREEGDSRPQSAQQGLSFQCLPAPELEVVANDIAEFPPMMMAAPAPMARAEAMDIVVTGARVTQEDLGDLKLYRVPHRTTLASMSQKQVAMLDRPSVPVDIVYRSRLWDSSPLDVRSPVRILLRTQNRKEKGLGIPLPQGGVALFERHSGERVLVGEGSIADKAVNEDVEVEIASATQVRAEASAHRIDTANRQMILTVTNALPYPVRYEADIGVSGGNRVVAPSDRLGRKNGRDLWAVRVPANGSATLRYQVRSGS